VDGGERARPLRRQRRRQPHGSALGDIRWNPKWDAAAQVTKDGWTAEAVIPFAALAEGATPERGWSFNIARTRRSLPKSAMVGVAEPGRKWKCESFFAKIVFE